MWVPLLGGGDPAVVQEWVRLASAEPNEQRRSEYAGVAMVFAEWAGHRAAWQHALEGFNVRQLEIVREWRDEGRIEGTHSALLLVLRERFQSEVPADLVETIRQTTDRELLSRWIVAAVREPSLEGFRNAVHPSSSDTP
jgi:hypothetical protein